MKTYLEYIQEENRALRIGKALVATAGIGAGALLGNSILKQHQNQPKVTKAKQVDNVPKNQKAVDDELRIMRNRK